MPIHVVEGAPKSGCHQYQCPWVSCSHPLALLGDLSTLAYRSGSASYEITAFTLGPSACETVCPPFTSEMSISTSPLGLLKLSPAGLQSGMLWGLVPQVQDHPPTAPRRGWGVGEPNVGLRALTPVGELLQFVGRPPRGHRI